MSQTELAQLDQCMEHLAFILDKLGVKEAKFIDGVATLYVNEQPLDNRLLASFCQHISSLYKEEMVEDAENTDPDVYFSV